MLRIIFLFLVIFDTNGVLDKYLKHDLFKVWFRNEAINFGWYYWWEVDDSVGLASYRRAFTSLKDGYQVPPDEVCRFAVENQNDNSFYISMKFNYQCQQHLMKVMRHEEKYFDLLEEFQRLHQIYDLMDDINRPQYVLWQKRKKCHKLKILLGEKDYDIGLIPPCVPLDAFVVID